MTDPDGAVPPEVKTPDPEFSRKVPVARIDAAGYKCVLEAEPAERAALASRFGHQSIDRLVAEAVLDWETRDETITMTGRLTAEVVQTCVVTLEPVAARLEEEFGLRFSLADADDDEIDVSIDAEDPPEPIIGDAIDLGEAVAQQLAMALDPYPRCPDASIEALEADAFLDSEPPPHPFAELARLGTLK